MRLVIAIIKPFKLEEVKEALEPLGVEGMTITESHGFARKRDHAGRYGGIEHSVDYLPKLRIETIVADGIASNVVAAIAAAARTGTNGDGTIFVMPIGEVIRIRTGETSEQAL